MNKPKLREMVLVCLILILMGERITVGTAKTIEKHFHPDAIEENEVRAVIGENHNEVMGTVAKWGTGMSFIHFDSHPDLGMPSFPPGVWHTVNNKHPHWARSAEKFTDIADWLLPLILTNNVKEVIWVAPAWSLQFQEGSYNVSIHGTPPDIVFSSSPATVLDYWASSNLTQGRRKNKTLPVTSWFGLKVVRHNKPFSPASQAYVIDVDEDYVTCDNPVLNAVVGMVGEAVAKDLGEILAFLDTPTELKEIVLSKDQTRLDGFLKEFPENTTFPNFLKWFSTWDGSKHATEEIFNLADIGFGLPRHVLTMTGLDRGVDTLRREVKRLVDVHGPPRGVSLSTSPGYVPHHLHHQLHSKIIAALDTVFPRVRLATQPPVGASVLFHDAGGSFRSGVVQKHMFTNAIVMKDGVSIRVPWDKIRFVGTEEDVKGLL